MDDTEQSRQMTQAEMKLVRLEKRCELIEKDRKNLVEEVREKEKSLAV